MHPATGPEMPRLPFPHPPQSGGCCTRLVEVNVTLGGHRILEDINLHVHCGELTALIGPNGAGKTTLLRAILGQVPHTGELRYLHAGSDQPLPPPRIGYVPQKLDLDAAAPGTVLDLFAAATSRRPLWLGAGRPARELAERSLAITGADRLLPRRLGELSGGQLQRVLLALALTPLPDLLLLDEPVAGVDRAGSGQFYALLSRLRREYDLAIILVSHDLAEVANVADRIIFLNRTVLADGTPAAVLANPAVRRAFALDLAAPPPPAAMPASFVEDAGR
jgi:zinc transport system ATP-binding protein